MDGVPVTHLARVRLSTDSVDGSLLVPAHAGHFMNGLLDAGLGLLLLNERAELLLY